MRFTALCLMLLLPAAAIAAEEPEAVYAKFHRAIAAGDLEEMLRYAPDETKAEMAAMSAAQKAASVKMIAALMPRTYVLKDKSVNPDGQGARLVLSGAGPVMLGDKPETLYGTIKMVMQRGDWKVRESNWSNSVPVMAQPAPKPAAPAAAAAAKPAVAAPSSGKAAALTPKEKSTAPIGSMDSAPEKKLGKQKPPCVYKPVMSAEDLENCR